MRPKPAEKNWTFRNLEPNKGTVGRQKSGYPEIAGDRAGRQHREIVPRFEGVLVDTIGFEYPEPGNFIVA